MIYKTSINLSEDAVEFLRKRSKSEGKTVADIIREAISTEKFLREAVDSGKKILIEDRDRLLRQVVFR
jgi:predicted DNA-binding protein